MVIRGAKPEGAVIFQEQFLLIVYFALLKSFVIKVIPDVVMYMPVLEHREIKDSDIVVDVVVEVEVGGGANVTMALTPLKTSASLFGTNLINMFDVVPVIRNRFKGLNVELVTELPELLNTSLESIAVAAS